ncbi:MAG: hypothetical protein JST28_19245 [Acidobacteria bacterium]|nr:hypothetical protein [Acidobacteriota bacterium]
MLPDFPTLKKILDDVAFLRIDAATREKWPILNTIRGFTAHEGAEHSFLQEGFGTIVQKPEAHQARVEIKFAEVPDLIGERLHLKLDGIATEMAKQAAAQFYARLGEETAKVGNAIDAEGKPMSQELALRMLERVEWTPDSIFLAHPTMAEALGKQWKEWEKDRAFMKQYNEIMSRKKEQWRDRESNRKLVD